MGRTESQEWPNSWRNRSANLDVLRCSLHAAHEVSIAPPGLLAEPQLPVAFFADGSYMVKISEHCESQAVKCDVSDVSHPKAFFSILAPSSWLKGSDDTCVQPSLFTRR